MSHFAVLVIGDDVEKQLAPYHEFECTGRDDEYVQDVDITQEAREAYEKSTSTRFRLPNGADRLAGFNRFTREPTEEELKSTGLMFGSGTVGGVYFYSADFKDGRGYRPKAVIVPDGYTEVELLTKEVKSLPEFVEEYYGLKTKLAGAPRSDRYKFGFVEVDRNGQLLRVVDRTNPNKKWDWYLIGGRWTGYFKLKSHALCAALGQPGIQTMDADYKPPSADRADMCLKADIDLDGMREEAGEKAAERWDLYHSIVSQHPPIIPFADLREKHTGDIGAARTEYWAQAGIQALRQNKESAWFEPDDFLKDRAAHIQHAKDRALSTFAVVRDGQWYEKGSMGWWGCVSDEKDETAWIAEFNSLLDGLPDNTMLTVVDCHI